MFMDLALCGGYFSSYTPTTLAHYLHLHNSIPHPSAYHVIGISHILLTCTLDTQSILNNILLTSANCNTLIDVCLPYTLGEDKYIGRHIIHRGKLVGVRLHTRLPCNTLYKNWPRHHLQREGQAIGQFLLSLNNLRIGLLFTEEVPHLHLEYHEYQADLISVVSLTGSQSIQSYFPQTHLLHTPSLNSIHSLDHKLFKVSPLDQAYQQHIRCVYIDFTPALTKRQHPRQGEENEKESLEYIPIDMNISQANTTHATCAPSFRLSSAGNGEAYTEELLHRVMKAYMVASKLKLVVSLDDSPQTICTLFLLQRFHRTLWECQIEYINQNCAEVNSLLGVETSPQSNRFPSMTLHALESIMQANEAQEYFPVLTANPLVRQSIQLINHISNQFLLNCRHTYFKNWRYFERDQLQFEIGELQTLVPITLLSQTEMEALYFSKEVLEFTGSETHASLWKHYKETPKFNDERSPPLQMPPYDSFSAHVSRHFDIPLNEIFAHYFYRNIYTLNLSEVSLHSETPLLPKDQLLQIYSLFSSQKKHSSPLIDRALLYRAEQATHQFCHTCLCSYPQELIVQCQVPRCLQYYCLGCLAQSGGCASCQNKCQINCPSCSIVKRAGKEAFDTANPRCHICDYAAMVHYQCSKCPRRYCLKCCRQNPSDHQKADWVCFACRGKCFCMACEGEQLRFLRKVEEGIRERIYLNEANEQLERHTRQSIVSDSSLQPFKTQEVENSRGRSSNCACECLPTNRELEVNMVVGVAKGQTMIKGRSKHRKEEYLIYHPYL